MILERARKKVKCDCGAMVSTSSIPQHKRSNRHVIWCQAEYWKGKSEWLLEQKKAGLEWVLTDDCM